MNTWIPLSDGCRLAARVWLPEATPAPAILEYLPYRKNDGTARRDALHHPYFASHGYVCVRVDMRGSGDSDGVLLDEYLPREQADAVEVIAWLAAQPWCSGGVGMLGISWGGFNGLQVAALRPPALEAVISLCSTDDRYADDVHYMGGCLLDTNLGWATTMLAYNARPPDPEQVGEGWRAHWLDRLDRTPPFIHAWLDHQRRDAYWAHGSVCEDYAAIACPVYLVSGWADGYPNAIPRLLRGLTAPRKALIGPWGHQYPEAGVPGPAIGFLQECVRWWDHWLKGIDTGVVDEPMVRAWVQESVPPAGFYPERPGRWVAEEEWPTGPPRRAWLDPRGLLVGAPPDEGPAKEWPVQVVGSQHAGLDAGARTGFGRPGDAPGDQRVEDGLSLTFTSEPLTERVELLGFPVLGLTLAADQPQALVAVRLCDVWPDGRSALLSRGLLNLTHRDGHAEVRPLEPAQRCEVRVQLNVVGCSVPARHRLRVSVSPTYWPHAWPSPEPVTLSVWGGMLELPVREPSSLDERLPAFGPPETAPPLEVDVLRPSATTREQRRDQLSGLLEMSVVADDGAWRQRESGLEYGSRSETRYAIREGDPLSAEIRCEREIQVGRGDWQTRVHASATMTADRENFHLHSHLEAFEGEVCVFDRTWQHDVPRDQV